MPRSISSSRRSVILEKTPLARRIHPMVKRAIMCIAVIAPLGLPLPSAFVYNVYCHSLAPSARWVDRLVTARIEMSTLIRIGGLLHLASSGGILTPIVLKWKTNCFACIAQPACHLGTWLFYLHDNPRIRFARHDLCAVAGGCITLARASVDSLRFSGSRDCACNSPS